MTGEQTRLHDNPTLFHPQDRVRDARSGKAFNANGWQKSAGVRSVSMRDILLQMPCRRVCLSSVKGRRAS